MPTTAEITQRYVQAHADIASAITNKGGTVNTGDGFEDFAADIGSIPTANIQPVTILSNGVYTVSGDVDGYSPVTVTVPNTYTLSDEGKVVSNGALVSQTSTTITTNNTTVDTTLIDSVTVNVPGSTVVADFFKLNVGLGPETYGAASNAVLCVYRTYGTSYLSYVTGTVHTANKAANCIMSINLTGFNGTHLSDYFSNNISKTVWFYSSSTRAWTVTYTINITTGAVSESSQVSSSYYNTTLKAFSQ